jgi:hypothetical protein
VTQEPAAEPTPAEPARVSSSSPFAFFGPVVVAVVFIVFAGRGLVPEVKAQFGNGKPGVFIATSQDCSGTRGRCIWSGDFVGADSSRRTDVPLSTSGSQPKFYGDSIQAVDSGDSDMVFPAGGSATWWLPIVLVAVGVGMLVNWVRRTLLPWVRNRR